MGPAAHPVSLCLSLGQYKASYSRHFISPDKQERQDKEIFRQNMKRRLETFKSTKHNICSSKSKARMKEKGRKKASGPQTAAPLLAVRFGLLEAADREVLLGVDEVLQGFGISRAHGESGESPPSTSPPSCVGAQQAWDLRGCCMSPCPHHARAAPCGPEPWRS